MTAPEILTGNGYNLAADWYSLGCTVYEMAYGKRPYYEWINDEKAM